MVFPEPPLYDNGDTREELIKKYRYWIRKNKEKEKKPEQKIQPFFFIHRSFLNCLIGKDILSPGAVKLYVYCGIIMDKDNGTTFVGLNRMSEELRVHKRTINKWFRELSDRHLIERHQLKFNGRCCTHVMPYEIPTHSSF